jgi:acetolactate synthase I/II/III large subunit
MSAGWRTVGQELARAGVELVVGLAADEPGLLDVASEHPDLAAAPVRNQRGAGALACGFSLTAGRPVAVALSSGPDFSGALPGLVEAASLGVPLVAVTSRIAAEAIGRGGFQELDQAGILAGTAKWHHLVPSADQLAWATRQAVRQAINRGGLVLLEISAEALAEQALAGADGAGAAPRDRLERPRSVPAPEELDRAAGLLSASSRPLILAGGGARAAASRGEIEVLAEALGAGVLTTASGRGAFDEHHPLACGLAGLYATPPLDALAAEADLVLALGSRLEETMRLRWPELAEVPLVQVDADPGAFGSWTEPAVALLGDVGLALDELVARVAPPAAGDGRAPWRASIEAAREAALAAFSEPAFELSPVRAALGVVTDSFADAIVVQENGLNDIWGYHFPVLRVGPGMTVIVPGEQTMLGFGLPAAIGARLAAPGRPVVAICGDGALGMSMTELPAAAELGCGLTLVVFDNGGLGWPRFLREEEASELTRFDVSWDWGELVRRAGGWCARPHDEASLAAALAEARVVADSGRIAAIVLAAPEGDVPVGVRRLHGEGGVAA